MQDKMYIGIDVGGTGLKASLVSREGEIFAETKIPTHSDWQNDEFCTALKELIDGFFINYNPQAIGIGTPGPIDIERGLILQSGNLANLIEVAVVDYLQQKYSIPVFFNNDANCAALGEYYFGDFQGSDNLIVLTLGTGLGCGWVYQGKIFNGYRGSGMEAGHTTIIANGEICSCGQRGCAEAYFSASGLLRRYNSNCQEPLTTAQQFFDEVRKKNEQALAIFQEGRSVLSGLIRNLAHTVNPEYIIFVGGLTASADLFMDYLQEQADRTIFPALRQQLKLAIGGKVAGSLGAAALCFPKKE